MVGKQRYGAHCFVSRKSTVTCSTYESEDVSLIIIGKLKSMV